ncbi:unnamed protein product [Rhizoctonia solani]|uniref:Uncharacterized protein n=1 Tax=Rhizoctonia solani TaxID=456999 RepID=A0A8H3D0M9_9AGAM|nr:unnamed protein product [Rhizoctonia solani]
MRFSILSFITLAAAAVAAQRSRRAVYFNPPASVVRHVDWLALPPASIEPTTNAKRFAQGLPPNNPLAFVATNSPSEAYPLFGGIVGFGSTDDNFGPGSYEYAQPSKLCDYTGQQKYCST